jgi:AraC-like DNA-binding protein
MPTLAPVPEVMYANRYRGSKGVIMHEHAGTEVVLVLRGRCRIQVADIIQLEGGPGTLFVLPARVQHDQQDEGEVETIYADFTVPARHFSERPRTIAVPPDSWTATWLAQLTELQREHLPSEVRSGLGLALMSHISHLEQRDEAHRALHPGVAKALRRMEEDLLEELTVGDLARAAGLSASHLTALFRQHLGCGPMAWQQKQRLELACRLLRNAYLAIADVAASSGYPDTNYFARLFRQAYGCSPTAWRRKRA